jgi:hypothetical protein
VFGLRSPVKGPGAIVSILFTMLSPPFVRALNGANRGLGCAYFCPYEGDGSNLSRVLGLALEGVALRLVGKRGKAESRLDDSMSGEGMLGCGRGLVALRFIG